MSRLKFYDEIQDYFETNKQKNVNISGKHYEECVGVHYTIDTIEELNELCSCTDVKPHYKDDQFERNMIINFFTDNVSKVKDDWHTRQMVYQPKYLNGVVELPGCISAIQFVVRNHCAALFVFVRSQNIDKNFLFDNITYAYVMKCMMGMLNVQFGGINVNVTSLHRVQTIKFSKTNNDEMETKMT